MRRMPVVAVGCLATAAAILAFLVASYTRETIPYEVAEVPLVEEAGTPAPEEEPAPIDWDALPGCVVAWVRVPGTTVDYPIVQGDEADPDYYLTHDIYGDASVWGTPYVDAGCRDGTRSPFVIVYAHHMSDGTMFGPLEQYADEAFAAAHRTILVYTREGTVELEVFAAAVLDANREGVRTDFADAAELQGYVDERLERCEVVLDHPEDAGRVWAFATCSYQTANSRTVVLAREVG